MDPVTYIRKHPWRPRSPLLGNRVGARRRGFRQDDLCPAPDALQDGVDLVVEVGNAPATADDIVLAEAASALAAQSAVAARVDVSGLLAIAAVAPRPVSVSPEDVPLPTAGWPPLDEPGAEESLLTRHSA